VELRGEIPRPLSGKIELISANAKREGADRKPRWRWRQAEPTGQRDRPPPSSQQVHEHFLDDRQGLGGHVVVGAGRMGIPPLVAVGDSEEGARMIEVVFLVVVRVFPNRFDRRRRVGSRRRIAGSLRARQGATVNRPGFVGGSGWFDVVGSIGWNATKSRG
jgi:hypothetical protein